MRILHLSDLHYGTRYKSKLDRMMPSLLKELKRLSDKKKFDFIVFTGDLVWAGGKSGVFKEAEKIFIEPMLKILSLKKENFIMCPGNHDMSEKKELPAITEFVDKISNLDDLDNFIKNEDQQFTLSYERSSEYFDYAKGYYENDSIGKLYHTFKRKINKNKIAFVSFHTAWRSFKGEKSINTLLLPKKTIHDALTSVSNSDLYISLMHHPIKDLKNFNSYGVEDVIYEKFHINFSGHYHKKNQGVVCANDIGMLAISSMATMSGNDGSTIGFSIVDIDVDTYDIIIDNHVYVEGDNVFPKTSSTDLKLPMNEEKSQQVHLIKSLREQYDHVLKEANSLLIDFENISTTSFTDHFETPVLKEKSYYESLPNGNELTKSFDIEDLVNNSFCIYGKDKFGKTSVLKNIQLLLIEDFLNRQIIPLYFDLKGLKEEKDTKILEEVKHTFRVSRKNAKKIISNSKFHFLIDNFDKKNDSHADFIKNIIRDVDNYQITITSEETQESYSMNMQIQGKAIHKIYVHPITRKNIRLHTSKMLVGYQPNEQHKIIEKIIVLFRQMNIPFNYWYLSLYLWIYKKEKNISINDNVEMLILYIDKLLEREQISRYHKDIDYELFKKLIGELAHCLLKCHANENYSASYSEIITFLEEFKGRNIRFVITIENIMEYLLDRGIIKRVENTGRYSFRLNGVMEYFTAIYMVDNSEFVDNVLNDDSYFLSFANEIEIFSGLKKNNLDILVKLHKKAEKVVAALSKEHGDDPDGLVNKNIVESKKFAESIARLNVADHQPINYEEQDEIIDGINPVQDFNEDVLVKQPVTATGDGITIDQIERHLFILGRAFRTLTAIENIDQMEKSFDLILSSYINIGFSLVKNINYEKDSKKNDNIENKIIKILTHFLPYFTQLLLSEAILQQNLTLLIEKKIKSFEGNEDKNQYKLFLLCFMLMDIDLARHHKLLDKLINYVEIFSLRNAMILKMMYYLGFKSCSDSHIEIFLKKKIIELQSSMKPDMDNNCLRQELDKKLLLKE